MNETLFFYLTPDELIRLDTIGLTRNVKIKDLTIGELDELKFVLFTEGQMTTITDVFNQLKTRRAIER